LLGGWILRYIEELLDIGSDGLPAAGTCNLSLWHYDFRFMILNLRLMVVE
jgi:hypothetical protein